MSEQNRPPKGKEMGEPRPPRFLDQVRMELRIRHYSLRTEEAYTDWIKRFIIFNGKRHPKEMGVPEIVGFLKHLAVDRHVSASTQNQAKAALIFLYDKVLKMEIPWLEDIVQARERRRLPVVLSVGEVRLLMGQLNGTMALVVQHTAET